MEHIDFDLVMPEDKFGIINGIVPFVSEEDLMTNKFSDLKIYSAIHHISLSQIISKFQELCDININDFKEKVNQIIDNKGECYQILLAIKSVQQNCITAATNLWGNMLRAGVMPANKSGTNPFEALFKKNFSVQIFGGDHGLYIYEYISRSRKQPFEICIFSLTKYYYTCYKYGVLHDNVLSFFNSNAYIDILTNNIGKEIQYMYSEINEDVVCLFDTSNLNYVKYFINEYFKKFIERIKSKGFNTYAEKQILEYIATLGDFNQICLMRDMIRDIECIPQSVIINGWHINIKRHYWSSEKEPTKLPNSPNLFWINEIFMKFVRYKEDGNKRFWIGYADTKCRFNITINGYKYYFYGNLYHFSILTIICKNPINTVSVGRLSDELRISVETIRKFIDQFVGIEIIKPANLLTDDRQTYKINEEYDNNYLRVLVDC